MSEYGDTKLIWLGPGAAYMHLEYVEYLPPLVIRNDGEWTLMGKKVEIHMLLNALKKADIDLSERQLNNFLRKGRI